jgi:hypothetical protein
LARQLAEDPGDYKITIAALGFEAWTAAINAGENQPSLSAVLKVAATPWQAVLSPQESSVSIAPRGAFVRFVSEDKPIFR